jgi:sulfatase modifying factor 1
LRYFIIAFAIGASIRAQPAVETPGEASFAGGTFVMGTAAAQVDELMARFSVRRRERFSAELPAHAVEIRPFAIDRTEVTNRAFLNFVIRHPEWRKERIPASEHNGDYLRIWVDGRYPQGDDNLPVTFITWAAASDFCQASGKRLPTEAEWEYAASGGKAIEFPWGEAMPDGAIANWSATGLHKPARVASFPPTAGGLYDMAGNVWEFVADRWSDDYASAPRQLSPERRVIRGGSFDAAAINLRVHYRDSHPASGAGPHVGFRCAR